MLKGKRNVPRPAKEQPLTAHLATITRVLNQIDAGKQLSLKNKMKVKQSLGDVLAVLQRAVVGPTTKR